MAVHPPPTPLLQRAVAATLHASLPQLRRWRGFFFPCGTPAHPLHFLSIFSNFYLALFSALSVTGISTCLIATWLGRFEVDIAFFLHLFPSLHSLAFCLVFFVSGPRTVRRMGSASQRHPRPQHPHPLPNKCRPPPPHDPTLEEPPPRKQTQIPKSLQCCCCCCLQ